MSSGARVAFGEPACMPGVRSRATNAIHAVIFDLDGVLVTTDELHYRAWREIADAEGIPFDRTFNHRLRGVGRMESLDIILAGASRAYSDDERRRLAARKNARYVASLAELSPADILPGVTRRLSELRQREIPVAVASSSRNARQILRLLELTPRFDVCVDGSEVPRTKPDPGLFLLAAQRLGVDPQFCLVVEDAMTGIIAARRAGMRYYGIGTPESLPGVCPIATGLDQVTVDQLIAIDTSSPEEHFRPRI